jgi:two-component system nitrate/nitrite response regulator NarL
LALARKTAAGPATKIESMSWAKDWSDAGTGGNGPIPASRTAAAARTWQHNRVSIQCLLVDDSDAFLQAASVLLQRGGMMVTGMASNSAEAIRQARALQPDVILVDIGLGEESGFDLASLLAQDAQAGNAGVILISARAESDYGELIAESPAAGFLAKSALSAQAIVAILDRAE